MTQKTCSSKDGAIVVGKSVNVLPRLKTHFWLGTERWPWSACPLCDNGFQTPHDYCHVAVTGRTRSVLSLPFSGTYLLQLCGRSTSQLTHSSICTSLKRLTCCIKMNTTISCYVPSQRWFSGGPPGCPGRRADVTFALHLSHTVVEGVARLTPAAAVDDEAEGPWVTPTYL